MKTPKHGGLQRTEMTVTTCHLPLRYRGVEHKPSLGTTPNTIELRTLASRQDRKHSQISRTCYLRRLGSRRSMTKSKQVTEVKRMTSEIPTRDEELHSEDIPFLRGGLQNGVRPREPGTAPLHWLPPRLSPHTLPITKWTTSCLRLFSSPNGVCYK